MIQIEARIGRVRLDDVVTKGLIDPLIDNIATLYGDYAVRNEWTNGEIVAVESGALETLEIEIDSVGGSVSEGYRLYKTLLALRERGVEVIANITKTAASMGSVIAMGADKVRMSDKGMFMIHDAQIAVKGPADTLRHWTNELEQISDEIAGIYASRTNQDHDAIRECMKGELYMNAATALRYRFVDEVYESEAKERNPSILERLIGNKAEIFTLDANANKVQKQTTCNMSLLDKLRPDAAQASKLEGVEAENTAIRGELEEAKALITGAAEEIAEFKAKLETAEAENTGIKAELEAKESELAEQASALEAEQAKTTPEAINKLVTASLATAGHPPIEENHDGELKTLKAQYNALAPGAERKAFRDKHFN